MSIESQVLCKEYKTVKGYLIAAGKYRNEMEELYQEIKEHRLKGNKWYLGEPVLKAENAVLTDLIDIKEEIKAAKNDIVNKQVLHLLKRSRNIINLEDCDCINERNESYLRDSDFEIHKPILREISENCSAFYCVCTVINK